jgi:hypothetical protein
MKKTFQNQDTEKLRRTRNFIFSLIVSKMKKSDSLRRRIRLLAEREEWTNWINETFPGGKFYWTRENLWKEMDVQTKSRSNWVTFEFGVAWGYTTNYWCSKLGTNITTWHGFDRFTGLPRSWRDLNSGAFDAKGQAPAISDGRIVWHVGDVEEELPKVELGTRPKLIFFDLDLYEPTHFAWNWLSPEMNEGDLIYFDEAFDRDERQVIKQNVLKEFDVEVVGFTHSAIAFKLGSRVTTNNDC